MLGVPSFCECVYAAKNFRVIDKADDPQLFIEIPSSYAYREGWRRPSVPISRRAVDGTTYAFPWSEITQAPYRLDNVFIRFWFDEKSGELRIFYLKPTMYSRES